MFRALILTIILLFASGSQVFAAKRVALVIGNAGYTKISRLNNPGNDAALMAETLKSVGFEVITATDVDFRGMRRALRQFGVALRKAGRDAVGLFYYSGHGVQSRGENYLLPLGAEIVTEYDLDIEAMSAAQVLGQMKAAGNRLNLVILDACRDNPFSTGTKSLNKGFARMRAPSGSLIAFAAAPGQTAADGNGRTSPYTAALAKAILTPGLQVEQVFKRVRVAVEDQTSMRQTPWEQSSLRGDFFFVPAEKKPDPVPQPVISSIKQDYAAAAAIGTKQAWQAFLTRHGSKKNDFHVQLAEAALKKLAVGVFPKLEPAKPKVEACTGIETTVAGKKQCLQHKQTFRDCPTCPEMVVIPPGKFMMASPDSEQGRYKDEGPRREVTISKAFAVGKFEVTFAEWDACVADGGCNGHNPKDKGWGRGRRPVINVSWSDAQSYVKWLSKKAGRTYRLLTEAEWEYAARAGTQTPFPWGATASHEFANYGTDKCCGGHASGRDKWKFTSPAGRFAANAFGLHDMHGNVWEWVEDCYKDSYQGAPNDGTAVTPGRCYDRVLRGGSWHNRPEFLRSANRAKSWLNDRSRGSGFRLARTLTP